MRKIIPYIASGFRKDRIWLRRTKPSAREYQVIVALDDSSSMRDNAVRNTAHKSLAIICQALSTLDVGKFGILGFGNQAKMIQPLQSNFSAEDGAHLLRTFTFEQTATHIAAMLAMARKAFANSAAGTSSKTIIFEKLLIIISDGRGIFNEGKETVIEAVRSARLENMFIIFLIVENMGKEGSDDGSKPHDSILDIRLASFNDAGVPTVVPYMEEFPFSHYVILRNVDALPQGLSDALRQWFSMVTSN
jgi:midasin